MMKKTVSLFSLLIGLSFSIFSQSTQNTSYTITGEKITNGTTSMTVSGSSYSTTTLTSGEATYSPGFLSIYKSLNNQLVANEIDSLALVDLYLSTNPGDTSWNSATGWLSSPLNEWQGVSLDENGRVTSLDLNNNNLTGTLPESLKNLDSLAFFHFDVNPNLEGNLFDFLSNYPKLQRVSAYDCNFSGPLLPEVFHSELLEIRVFNNQLTGEIPVEIGNSILMEQFDVSENQLTGTIPTSIGELISLVYFNLSGNDITGGLPTEIEQMNSLQTLFLDNLNLEGEVPVEILNCPSLIEFLIAGNNFTGTLPDVLNMPGFRVLQAGGNSNLLVELPDNIGDLTQLVYLSIWNTKPNGSEFPEGIYNLTNLTDLDLSEQQFTGSIDERIGNLTKLKSLYLRSNQLEGAFPVEISSAVELNTFDISSNNFNFLPDISGLSSLENIYVQNNQLQFASIIPFTTIPLTEFSYSPQKSIGETSEITLPVGGNTNLTTDINNIEESNYQWIFNGDSLANATAVNLQINNFNTSKAGIYELRATHPELPNLTLNSAFIFLKIDGNQRSWYVDNRANTVADFRTLQQAINATSAGDTLYISGSEEPYSGVSLNSPRVFIGPGYFLEENIGTQYNKQSAIINGAINLTKNIENGGMLNASGTKIFGLEVNQIFLQNVISVNDTLENIEINGVKTNSILIIGSTSGLNIRNSFIMEMNILGEELGTFTFSSYRDSNRINNNIIKKLGPYSGSIGFSNELTNISNVDFNFNTIDTIQIGIENLVIENSLIRLNESTNLTSTGSSIGDYSSLLENNSATFSIDNDFQPIENNLSQGAFAGNDPYVLSGLPPIPSIYNIEIGTRLSAKVAVKSNNGNNIMRLRYQYRRNNQSSSSYNVRGFNPNPNLEVEFLPNRSNLQPNQTYSLVLVAIDENGKRSHRNYIPYETISANLSGNVVDIENVDVNEGNIRLFAINPFANKYDTAAVQPLAGNNTFNFENLILGDYIILADPDEDEYPDLIPTYLGNTLDWQIADTLLLQGNSSNIRIEVEKEPTPLTEPGSTITGFLDEEYDEADSTLRVLPRRRISGAGVSVRRLTGSSRLTESLRLLDSNYELLAYIKTNENGEFTFPNLPSGDYRIRVEYPGVEVDETTDIDFNLSGNQAEVVNVEALVEDGKIKITETGRVTANDLKNPLSFSFYPNPVKNELNLKLENILEGNEIIIFDLKGVIHKQIKVSEGQTKINLETLTTGTYIIRLQDSKGNYIMSKLIKE